MSSDSVSSFASIGQRASSAEWQKFLTVNAARLETETAALRRDALIQLVASSSALAPGSVAGLSAGLKVKCCSWRDGCDRPARDQKRGGYCLAHHSEYENNRVKAAREKQRRESERRKAAFFQLETTAAK